MLYAFKKRRVEGANLFGLAVGGVWQRDAHGEHVVSAEAGVDLEDLLEAADEETGPGYEEQRESCFADDEYVSQTPGALSFSVAAALENVEIAFAACLQSGCESEENSGEDRDGSSEGECAQV